MRRREFIVGLGGVAVLPVVGRAQKSKVPVIGLLHSTTRQLSEAAFREGLREGGFIEGQNVLFEFRAAGGAYERLPSLGAELAELPVNVIAAFGNPAVRAAQAASRKSAPALPVVFSMASDPVAEGFVESLNRPGQNMTGATSISGALAPKRLELIREFLRDDAAIALLINPGNPLSEPQRREAEEASRAIGQRIEVLTAGNSVEIDKAFAVLKDRKISVLIVAADVFYYTQMQRLASLAVQAAIPVIGPRREFAAEGGLISYGASVLEVNRLAGVLAGKILKGSRPADLPVLQPTKFELVVNLRTAKSLGIDLSAKLLALADEVIE